MRRSPEEFAREMRLAAAIHWYSRGSISQSKAAEIAGVSRAAFLEALAREEVEACQVTTDELRREVELSARLVAQERLRVFTRSGRELLLRICVWEGPAVLEEGPAGSGRA